LRTGPADTVIGELLHEKRADVTSLFFLLLARNSRRKEARQDRESRGGRLRRKAGREMRR